MRYVLTDRAIAAVRILAAGVLADPNSQPSDSDLARQVRKLFKDAAMVPAEDMAEVARYARDRAREGKGSKDRDIAEIADSILVALAESKIPDEAVLVLGRRGETSVSKIEAAWAELERSMIAMVTPDGSRRTLAEGIRELTNLADKLTREREAAEASLDDVAEQLAALVVSVRDRTGS